MHVRMVKSTRVRLAGGDKHYGVSVSDIVHSYYLCTSALQSASCVTGATAVLQGVGTDQGGGCGASGGLS